jgi:hypothetical protein
MNSFTDINSTFKDMVNELMSILSPKEQEVINKRNSITTPIRMTLQAIGEDMFITRERVRQIEKKAISKIERNQDNLQIKELVVLVEKTLSGFQNLVKERQLIKHLEDEGTKQESLGVYYIALQISQQTGLLRKTQTLAKTWYNKTLLNEVEIKAVVKEAVSLLETKGSAIEEQTLLDSIAKKLNINTQLIPNILSITTEVKNLEGVYGLAHWRNVNPKSIKDKAVIILKRAHRPLHFRTINKLIHDSRFDHKQVTVEAVHNELIRYEDFVLVGRGLYALSEWGYTKGTVKDVIYQILEEYGPLKKKEIVEHVLKKRQVKIGTISLNLQKNTEFKRVGRAIYSI